MASIFCCPGIKPYRPQSIDQELKFTRFMAWAGFPKTSVVETQEPNDTMASQPTHVIQVVQQVNYGPLESKRYFAAVEQKEEPFVEVTERGLIEANYAKVNSYKNFKCAMHDKFFELNLYQKDPVNTHHWRANIARPAGEIDL